MEDEQVMPKPNEQITDTTPLEFREYKVTLEIGLCNACQEGEINPSDEYTEAQWNALTREQQEAWLDEQTKDWAGNYIDHYWV